ncbi:MAG: TerB family tellurite resistance protein [Kordiimonadaceae bacterium]|nr:TerB family tellurite resistance protein [Kordiimonadaceae bacterium]MBO6567794.1 TerB family tellurite resistance protein [Kordiimonadaceae bacterium]MBO6962991.1 TerB family tellurite resistance protein [Kordiimonadaceae bacterium]
MSISNLSRIMEMFNLADKELSAEEKKELVEEVLLMTLARATSADCNIDSVEVASVQAIIKEATGSEVSPQDIRIAAISDLFKEASLKRYLQKVAGRIDVEDRQLVVSSLGKLIKVDGKVSPFEVDFFNEVVEALGLTPAELAGLAGDTITR